MRIHIKATNLKLTNSLLEYAKNKIGSLAKFVKKYEKNSEVDIYLELARTTRHHKQGSSVYHTEINADINGKLIRAEYQDVDIRKAIDFLKDTFQRRIEKIKGIEERQRKGIERPGKLKK